MTTNTNKGNDMDTARKESIPYLDAHAALDYLGFSIARLRRSLDSEQAQKKLDAASKHLKSLKRALDAAARAG